MMRDNAEDYGLGRFLGTWLLVFVLVVVGLYVIISLSPRDARDPHDPLPRPEGGWSTR